VANRFVTAQFDRGQKPVVTVVNEAKTDWGVPPDALVAALRKYVDLRFAPVWGIPATMAAGSAIKKGTWGLVFLDDADQANALGYHDLTPEGFPLGKVFVRTTLSSKNLVSVTASHELAEMLADPAINLAAQASDGTFYAYEVADPVEEETFDIDGIPMSNFVYPSWFEGFRKPRTDKFDELRSCQKPFQIQPGGYMSIFRGGQWTQIFGSKRSEARFEREDRRERRPFRRGRPLEISRLTPAGRREGPALARRSQGRA
jgi:hypothetical protein